ncbi:Retrovirus-related Pol polyprotein from transposon [Zancudomyces culisetae]|uniref:RNA-directed DNA polymerase n=1 Tax=Zancudomyces culisetae TaxID=1213189 RepID=A0A1R1PEF0_ZANCU|nr:Retrovirus-related Pol polyprotein from transposon [Zancudomyces culisetae]|eukprot:OMH79370.1 Retrovirus-related Pol polyprotein from transposon [Zancudomyces culisetae]
MITPKTFESDKGTNPEDWVENYRLVAKQNSWEEQDWIDLVKLYLGKKEAIWYKKNKGLFTDWDTFSKLFIEKFRAKETKSQIWDKLRTIKHSDYNSIEELEYELELLCEKAGIVKDEIKLDLLVSTLKDEFKEKLEESGYKNWDKVIKYISNLERAEQGIYRKTEGKERVTKFKEITRNAASKQGRAIKDMSKDKEPYAAMIRKFEELSVNLLAKVDEVVEKKLKTYNLGSAQVYKCYYCHEDGHRKFECKKWKSLQNDEQSVKTGTNVNYIELVRTEDCQGQELVAVEKRKSDFRDITSEKRANKRINTAATPSDSSENTNTSEINKDVDKINKNTPLKAQVYKRYINKITDGTKKFSLKEELDKIYPKISLIQLLNSSPGLTAELVSICDKSNTAEINEIQLQPKKVTNCKAQVQIFGQNILAVVDTGAACSVVSSSMVEDWGLNVDENINQVIVTADGKRHAALGKVNKIPVKIASYIFPANLIVMNKNDGTLILGTDWLIQHKASINLRIPEIRFPIENAEVITRLVTSNISIEEESEIYLMIKEKPKGINEIQNTSIQKVLEEYNELFVEDISELQQTNVSEHRIEVTENTPIKLRPYRIPKYIPNYAKVASPITKLLKKNEKWDWGEKQDKAVEDLKELLTTAPILGHPDWQKEFVITTDASILGIGAVLSQGEKGSEVVIEFASRTTNSAEKNYSISHLEALAVVWAVKKFKYYVWGRKFKIRTDHKSLIQIFNGPEITSRIARWAMILRNYDFEIEHLPGKFNPADGLSRLVDNVHENNNELDVFAMEYVEYDAVRQYLADLSYPSNSSEQYRKKIRNKSRQYRLKNGKLFKRVKNILKEVLHEQNVKDVVNEIHNAAHEGIENTWNRVSAIYCGHNLYKDVYEIVKCCHICQLYKDGRTKKFPLVPIIARKPFEIIGMDAIGPFTPETTSGNRFILTAIDFCTKWPIAVPV